MKSLKLNQIEKDTMSKKEMQQINGGGSVCGCGCLYANSGGSESCDNYQANKDAGLYSEQIKYWYFDDYGYYESDVYYPHGYVGGVDI